LNSLRLSAAALTVAALTAAAKSRSRRAGRRARRCRRSAAHAAAALAALSRFKFSRSIASDISKTLSLASWNHRDKPDDPSLEYASMNFKKLTRTPSR
jgi:hypothetical protein